MAEPRSRELCRMNSLDSWFLEIASHHLAAGIVPASVVGPDIHSQIRWSVALLPIAKPLSEPRLHIRGLSPCSRVVPLCPSMHFAPAHAIPSPDAQESNADQG